MKNKKTILFVCTGNSCRSQMAEGLMRKYIEKDFSIISAGLKPSTVNPQAIKAMKEINDMIDMDSEKICQAPTKTPVKRLDETKANRELDLCWENEI